jgi:hypothetical protein
MKKYLSDLISIDVHKLVNEAGECSRQIGEYQVSLIPEIFGARHFLLLFVNNQRQNKFWELSSQPHNGWLRRNGFIPHHHDQIWFVVGSNGKRYRYLFIDPETTNIGTRDDHFPGGVHRQYRRKKDGGSFQDQCRAMEKQLFGNRDEFAAFHEKTVKRYRLRG